MCKGLLKGFSVVLIVCWAAAVFAAVPQTVNYQGYLKDAAGSPVNTQVDITFSLYTQANGGTPIWLETKAVIPQNGIYSVTLEGFRVHRPRDRNPPRHRL